MERKKLYCGLCLAVVISAAAAVNGAEAQETLGRGKTPAQTFASDCVVCHKSPQGLAKSASGLIGVEGFLREHYTSSRESAAALANYLRSVGTAPGAARAKRPAKGDQPKADEWAGPKPAEAKGPTASPTLLAGAPSPPTGGPRTSWRRSGERWNRGRTHPRMAKQSLPGAGGNSQVGDCTALKRVPLSSFCLRRVWPAAAWLRPRLHRPPAEPSRPARTWPPRQRSPRQLPPPLPCAAR